MNFLTKNPNLNKKKKKFFFFKFFSGWGSGGGGGGGGGTSESDFFNKENSNLQTRIFVPFFEGVGRGG